MNLASNPDIASYTDFNDFFTRKINPDYRPVSLEGIACPIDGSISQIGKIHETTMIQAKGRYFDLEQLVTLKDEANKFKDGNFVTLYLSPRDYHRIHMPIEGQLNKMIYVPGKLFSVNAVSSRIINNLYSRNERVICIFDTDIGPMAIIMIGALFVGSMETVWAGNITPDVTNSVSISSYTESDRVIKINKGDEMGRFNMGSSVILLFAPDAVKWQPEFTPGHTVIMGSCMGALYNNNYF